MHKKVDVGFTKVVARAPPSLRIVDSDRVPSPRLLIRAQEKTCSVGSRGHRSVLDAVQIKVACPAREPNGPQYSARGLAREEQKHLRRTLRRQKHAPLLAAMAATHLKHKDMEGDATAPRPSALVTHREDSDISPKADSSKDRPDSTRPSTRCSKVPQVPAQRHLRDHLQTVQEV